MIKQIHIYDMDGTIVCSKHRYRTRIAEDGSEKIDLDFWVKNEPKAFYDSLLPLAEQYKADLLDPETMVIIATARHLKDPDKWFIRNCLGMPDFIVSRESRSDKRSGALLKILGIQAILSTFTKKPTLRFWEDNVEYLEKVCKAVGAEAYYVPSEQGH